MPVDLTALEDWATAVAERRFAAYMDENAETFEGGLFLAAWQVATAMGRVGPCEGDGTYDFTHHTQMVFDLYEGCDATLLVPAERIQHDLAAVFSTEKGNDDVDQQRYRFLRMIHDWSFRAPLVETDTGGAEQLDSRIRPGRAISEITRLVQGLHRRLTPPHTGPNGHGLYGLKQPLTHTVLQAMLFMLDTKTLRRCNNLAKISKAIFFVVERAASIEADRVMGKVEFLENYYHYRGSLSGLTVADQDLRIQQCLNMEECLRLTALYAKWRRTTDPIVIPNTHERATASNAA